MDDLGDNLTKVGAELIRAGAILPAVGGGCFYFVAWLIEIARDLVSSEPLYWLCFVFAATLGIIGCAAFAVFVVLHWRERTQP